MRRSCVVDAMGPATGGQKGIGHFSSVEGHSVAFCVAQPCELDIIFSSVLSDTHSHAGKRKHLLLDAAATSSSEGSSQAFALLHEGPKPRGRSV